MKMASLSLKFLTCRAVLPREKQRAELMKNVKEAIHEYLEALKEHGDPVPIETVQVSV